MPLSAAKSGLQSGIKTAYNNAKAAASQDGASPSAIISALAEGIGNAIHNYMMQAQVDTVDLIPPETTMPPAVAVLPPTSAVGKGSLS